MKFLVPGTCHTVAIEGKSYKVPANREVTLPNSTSLKIVAHLVDMDWKCCDSGTEEAAADAVGGEEKVKTREKENRNKQQG